MKTLNSFAFQYASSLKSRTDRGKLCGTFICSYAAFKCFRFFPEIEDCFIFIYYLTNKFTNAVF